MALESEIESKVSEIVDGSFSVSDVSYVPDIDDSNLTFGNVGLKFTATVLFIDMRGSTKILNNHNRSTVAKIHMAYFHSIVKVARNMGGEVRSFNGDGMLVFFQGKSVSKLNDAVKAAMQMTYILNQTKVNQKLSKYSNVNFGIGLHYGDILCTKVGIAGTNNRDLVWIGNAVNKSVKIGDSLQSPNHVGISSLVRENLSEQQQYHETTNAYGHPIKVDMWNQAVFSYNDSSEYCYTTNYYWTVD